MQLNKLKAIVANTSKGHAQASTCVMVRASALFSLTIICAQEVKPTVVHFSGVFFYSVSDRQ